MPTITELNLYPVKSCAGISLREAMLTPAGLMTQNIYDREWMVVDAQGEFLTQRSHPKMALIVPRIKSETLELRAPGMLALHLAIDTVEEPVRVKLWGAELPAYDMGAVAAQWFTDFLGQPLRLVRFDPEFRRLASLEWTQGAEAQTQFADGYPLLVASTASLDLLNEKLAAAGHAPVTMERFRPNIVLDGLEAHDEDRLDLLRIATAEGAVVLRPVKPCPRCPIPNVDPATGETEPTVMDTLQGYRRNEIVGGAVSFAMNAIVVEGIEKTLRVGDAARADFRFD